MKNNGATKVSKITKATFKSFLRKNEGKVLIQVKGAFDGMTDCMEFSDNPGWAPIEKADRAWEENCGYAGDWVVGGSRNSFQPYEKDGLKGISVWNCCRSFTVAVRV